MVGAIVVEDVFNGPAGIVAAPVVPAIVLLFLFTDGPHGASIGWSQQVAAIFVIGVAMWWAIFEACRWSWNRLRPKPNATRPPT